jgi:hypothetical protein
MKDPILPMLYAGIPVGLFAGLSGMAVDHVRRFLFVR